MNYRQIYYFGKLTQPERITELQDEFQEIAQVSGWQYERINQDFSKSIPALRQRSLRGINIFLQPKTSVLQITFDDQYCLAHIFFGSKSETDKKNAILQPVFHQVHPSTKILANDSKTHVILMKILNYLRKKYVWNLEVIDSTEYDYSRDLSNIHLPALLSK
jgi:hypothetical protein